MGAWGSAKACGIGGGTLGSGLTSDCSTCAVVSSRLVSPPPHAKRVSSSAPAIQRRGSDSEIVVRCFNIEFSTASHVPDAVPNQAAEVKQQCLCLSSRSREIFDVRCCLLLCEIIVVLHVRASKSAEVQHDLCSAGIQAIHLNPKLGRGRKLPGQAVMPSQAEQIPEALSRSSARWPHAQVLFCDLVAVLAKSLALGQVAEAKRGIPQRHSCDSGSY